MIFHTYVKLPEENRNRRNRTVLDMSSPVNADAMLGQFWNSGCFCPSDERNLIPSSPRPHIIGYAFWFWPSPRPQKYHQNPANTIKSPWIRPSLKPVVLHPGSPTQHISAPIPAPCDWHGNSGPASRAVLVPSPPKAGKGSSPQRMIIVIRYVSSNVAGNPELNGGFDGKTWKHHIHIWDFPLSCLITRG